MDIKFNLNGTEYSVPVEVASYIKQLQDENSKSYKKELFTPQRAAEVLKELYLNDETKAHNQRGRKATAINGYKKDMENGNWVFCGDSIRFDVDGLCIDGQQRLNAIVESGKAQEFIVVRDLPTDCKRVIDSGYKKTIEDYLKSAEKGYKLGATAIVKQVSNFNKKRKNSDNSIGNNGLTYSDIIDYYRTDMQWFNSAAEYGGEISKKCKALRKTEVGSMYYYLVCVKGVDENRVREFFNILSEADYNKQDIYGQTVCKLVQKECRGALRYTILIDCWNKHLTYKKKNISEEIKNYDWFLTPQMVDLNRILIEENEMELAMAEAQ